MVDDAGISSPFCDMGKQRSAGGNASPRFIQILAILSELWRERPHRWNETDIRAADRALSGDHGEILLRGRAAAVFLWAVEAYAILARNACRLGNSFIAWNLLFNRFSHAAFAALGACVNFLVNGVVAICDLDGFGTITGFIPMETEHGAA